MIANLKYGESIPGIVNYVYKKVEENQGKVIGASLLDNPTKKELIYYLKYQGEQKNHKDPYSHFSLSLAIDDSKISDKYFNNIAHEFMDKMGYTHQPYVVVRHTDTEHQHVHIISTNVTEEGKKIYLHADRIRAKNICRKLEKKYGLKKVPNIKTSGESIKTSANQNDSMKFKMENAITEVFEKHKPRTVEQFTEMLLKYNVSLTLNKPGSKNGITFGILDENGKLSQKPIPGSRLHPNYSIQKVSKILEYNNNNPKLRIHKKRLTKQINNQLDLFKSIHVNDLPHIFQQQKIVLQEVKNDQNKTLGFRVIDKSGFVFKASEVHRNFTLKNAFSKINFKEEKTVIDHNSKAFKNLVNRIYKEAYSQYKKSHISKAVYESNLLQQLRIEDLEPFLKNSETHTIFNYYIQESESGINAFVQELKASLEDHKTIIPDLKDKEKALIQDKIELVDTIAKDLSNVSKYYIFKSLGLDALKEGREVFISHPQDKTYQIQYNSELNWRSISEPHKKHNGAQARYLNQKVLFHLFSNTPKNDKDENKFINSLGKNTLYLNLFYNHIYDNFSEHLKSNVDNLKNKTYTQAVLKESFLNVTDARDFIRDLNYKGVKVVKNDVGILTAFSVFTNESTAIDLEPKYKNLLENNYDLENILNHQSTILDQLTIKTQKEGLQQLWVADLIRNGNYLKAAYLMVNENIKPFMDPEELHIHNEEGLSEAMEHLIEQNNNKKLIDLLESISYLLDDGNYNDSSPNSYFVDELTLKKKKKRKRGFKL